MSIPESVLRSCLQLLEPHAAHPATPALHDPVYGLLDGDSLALEAAIAQAVMVHAGHPAASQIRTLLSSYVSIEDADLAAVLARHGPIGLEADLVGEVDRRLSAAAASQRVMRGHIQHLEAGIEKAQRSSNAVAAVGAFSLLFALVGWAIALGVFEIHWMDAPVPSNVGAAQTGRGAPALDQAGRP